jgi:hypothetical protein
MSRAASVCVVLVANATISAVAADDPIGQTPQPVASVAPSPTVSRCVLETTRRVAFNVDNAPSGAVSIGLRLRFYDSRKAWLADELINNAGISAPILPVAGLFDPGKVASVTCSIEGYVSDMDQRGFVSLMPLSATGRRACSQPDGLDVDGGPDADVDTALIGRNWIMVKFFVFINHFFANQESEFTGDVFLATLDHGSNEKVVVSGTDPQPVSFLFTGLQPGFHQVDYGPWFAADAANGDGGYHNVCVVI